MPGPTKSCEYELLASGPIAIIERCRSCGCISIHVGATTIRMEPDAMASLWATVEDALTELHSRSSGPLSHGWHPVPARGTA